jgi:uncharacterized cupin superfamily protein
VTEEARLEDDGYGLRPRGEGWFVLNTRRGEWRHGDRRGAICFYEGDGELWQLGINVSVLEPGQAMAMYHWEADQEDFLVVSGRATAIVEGEERPLEAWDLFHCPPGTKHTIVGAGDGPCVIVAVGARQKSVGPEWGAYVPEAVAEPYGASVEEETADPETAYAKLGERQPMRYDGWLEDTSSSST